MGNKSIILRKVLASALTLAVGSFYALVPISAKAQTASKTAGQLSVNGPVTLNGTKAVSGITIFSDSVIKTDCNAGATVNINKLGRVQFGQGTEMTIRFSQGSLGGNLRSGRITLSAPAGVNISVMTPDGIVTPDDKQASVLTVEISNGKTRVAANRGKVAFASGNKTHQVAAGQEVAVDNHTQNIATCQRAADVAAGQEVSARAGQTADTGTSGGGGSAGGAGGGVGGGLSGGAITGIVAGAITGTAVGVASSSGGSSVSPIRP